MLSILSMDHVIKCHIFRVRSILSQSFSLIRCAEKLNKNITEMVFKCQEDSFLKEFSSIVVSCEKTKDPIVQYGKNMKFDGYKVVLDNTILFPAGGGQPSDHGWLDDTEVLQVTRKGDVAEHFVSAPMEVGKTVAQKLDWEKRFDHMQQHSGQHLLSAILENEFKLPTTSWWLGAEESYVELDSNTVTKETIRATEQRCNELIRQALPVTVKMCSADDPGLDMAQTRGLPEDHTSIIRIINIHGIDENMCCGTHVSCLSQLQSIKLLSAEPGKKGKTNLNFLVGNRLLQTMDRMLAREKALTGLLKNEPTKHEELVSKLQKTLKYTNKNLQNVLGELAQFEVDKIKAMDTKPKYIMMSKKEATPEFNRLICKGLESEGIFLFLTSEDPDKPNEGQILIQGPDEHTNKLGSKLIEQLKGKGAFKNGKFQGKAGDMKGVTQCKIVLDEYFA